MSTLDQAFVKAFARRQQPQREPAAASESSIVWIDEQQDEHLRADTTASPAIPKPQLAGKLQRETSPPTAVPPAGGPAKVAEAPPDLAEEPAELETAESGTAPLHRFRVDPPHVAETKAVPPASPFQAVWEVDAFDLPAPVTELFLSGAVAADLSRRMSGAVEQGLRTVLFSSTGAQEGRTTAAIGIAIAVAAAGYRVALIDGNAAQPTLVDDLRLDLEYGWVDALRGGLPVEEIAVHSLRDGVTLIPLMPPNGDTAATANEIETLVNSVKGRFDFIAVDGPAGAAAVVGGSHVFDTALIVRDLRATTAEETNALSCQLRQRGIQGIGVIENFS